ncbi:hypothetical protein COOONC_03591 [Cooperia oncophora]
MDERPSYCNSKMPEFSTADQRADFWKVRLVSQNANKDKIYFFPSLLEWLKEKPQCVLSSALVAKEAELGIQLPDKLDAAVQKECANQSIKGDPVTSYVGGYSNTRPTAQDIGMIAAVYLYYFSKTAADFPNVKHSNPFPVNHLQRSYMEMYERSEHGRSRELVSLIDASLILGVASYARKLSEENNYEHDLLQLHHKLSSPDVWDDYKTTVMLRLSRGGTTSPETLEAATITRLICDLMAGPSPRRRSAIAEMAACGLKLDAMILARLYYPGTELCERLFSECSSFFEESLNSETKEIADMVSTTTRPFFKRHLLRYADQLSCYRILRIDFALNEKAPLEKKLVGRLEISKDVRYLIAHALAYRNFEAIALIIEDAVHHLDKYSFFSELEQIVAMDMLIETVRMIFHAKPAAGGWKKQRDEGDKLGCALQQHPNGYIGGLVEMWVKRAPLMEISKTRDEYRQHSLHTSIEGIASVLRVDDLLNPVCRGMLLFACDLVRSFMDGLFGRNCLQIEELIKANPCLESHTGAVLARRLTKGMLSPHPDDRMHTLLERLCGLTEKDALANREDAFDSRADDNADATNGKAIYSSNVPASTEVCQKTVQESLPMSHNEACGGAMAAKRKGEEVFDNGCRQLQRRRLSQGETVCAEPPAEKAATHAGSDQNSDMNDSSSVAPSRSVCEQVATMMEGVKYCREREANKNANQSHAVSTKAKPEPPRRMKEEAVSPSSVPPGPVAAGHADHSSVRAPTYIKGDDVGPADHASSQGPVKVEEAKRDVDKNATQMREDSPNSSNGTECAQIISDDHLDFSSSAHDPSLKTKWLPGDTASSCDKTGDEALYSTKNAGDEKRILDSNAAAKVTERERNMTDEKAPEEPQSTTIKETAPSPDHRFGADLESSVNKEEPIGTNLSVDVPRKEDSRLQPPLSPDFTEGGRKSPHPRQLVDKGKAMIQKLLTENNNVNSRPRHGSERQYDSTTKPVDDLQKTRSFADFTEGKMDQPNPFGATRENVFCTSSKESLVDEGNASFDDDIAAVFTRPSDVSPKAKRVEAYEENAWEPKQPEEEGARANLPPSSDEKHSKAQRAATPTNTPLTPLSDEPVKHELSPAQESTVKNTNNRLDCDEHDRFLGRKFDSETINEKFPVHDERNVNVAGQEVVADTFGEKVTGLRPTAIGVTTIPH